MEREERFGNTWVELSLTPVGLEVTLKVHLIALAESLNADLDDRARGDLVTGLAEEMEPAAAAALITELAGRLLDDRARGDLVAGLAGGMEPAAAADLAARLRGASRPPRGVHRVPPGRLAGELEPGQP